MNITCNWCFSLLNSYSGKKKTVFKMNFFLETLRFIGLLIYLILEAFVLLFIPVRKKSVAGEIVLITGAGSGMGRLLALKFGQLGATLVLWDINVEGNKETARLARENGARVHAYTCDCSRRQDVYQVADQVKYGLCQWFCVQQFEFNASTTNFLARSQYPQSSGMRNCGKRWAFHLKVLKEDSYLSAHIL